MEPIKNIIQLPFLNLRIYGLTFGIAILFSWAYTKHRLWLKGKNVDKNGTEWFLMATTIIGILGARLWYVMSNLSYYLAEPIRILKIWEGGIAIQGGIVAAFLGSFWLIKKIDTESTWIEIADIFLPSVLICQALGRWGNFYNQEIYGAIIIKAQTAMYIKLLSATQIILVAGLIIFDKPWEKIKIAKRKTFYIVEIVILAFLGYHALNLFGLGFANRMVEHMNINGGYRLPLFLVEGTINILAFILILFVKNVKPGEKFAYAVITMGTVRGILEPLRNQSDIMKIGGIYISVALSIIYVAAGIFMLVQARKGRFINGK